MKKLLFPVIALTLILLMAAAVSASEVEIWTIGTYGDDIVEFEPHNTDETSYTMGDPTSTFPGWLNVLGTSYGPPYVDIYFSTTMPYAPVTLLYNRAGAEKDMLYLDGVRIDLDDCFVDETLWKEFTFNIDEILPLPDPHTLKIVCVGCVPSVTPPGCDGKHVIDWLQLSGNLVEPTVSTGRSDPDTAYVGEVTTWTITIEICGDDVVDLNDVVVQGGIGADLVIIEVNGGEVDSPMARKTEQTVVVTDGNEVTLIKKGGKMGATIVRWDIGTLISDGCLTLELTVETGLNPKDKQEFTSEGTHELDGGFSATYWYEGMEYETPETDPLPVEAIEE